MYKPTYNHHMMFPSLESRFYSDAMFTRTKSIRMNKAAQVFIDGKGDTHFYPLKDKKMVSRSLMF